MLHLGYKNRRDYKITKGQDNNIPVLFFMSKGTLSECVNFTTNVHKCVTHHATVNFTFTL